MARQNPAMRAALSLALMAVGLLGLMFGFGQVGFGPARAVTLPAIAAGFGLILLAVAVFWWSRPGGRQLELRDPVTGLYAAPYVDEVLPGLMARDDRAGHSSLVLVRVGIDSIEEVRRRYGRQAENMVLASVGRHIRSQTREDDLPAEPDGQGFEIFLHCADIDQAGAFCRRLATSLSNEQLYWQGDVIKVSVSMEVTARDVGESLQALQQRAVQRFLQANAHAVNQARG